MTAAELVFSRDALREVDRRSVEEFGIPILALMENAGRSVADAVLRHARRGTRVLLLAGPGNNGGDALAAARHVHNAGIAVEVLLLTSRERYTRAAGAQLGIVSAMKIPTDSISADHSELRDWVVDSSPGDLIVDGLFGTGLSRKVEGLAAEVIRAANGSHHPIISIDIPSGMDCDTGRPAGDPAGHMIRAVETISFCGLKKGFGQAEARAFTGKVTVVPIGAPREVLLALAEH
jgi:NAD(P)H-hydrate epimerase